MFSPTDTTGTYEFVGDGKLIVKFGTVLTTFNLTVTVDHTIDPLDPNLLALQELAAVLACSDRRYLPPAFQDTDRAILTEAFAKLKARTRGA